ncbi:ankyrin repeat protein [Hesseltinella vesiculosa]|uniref:Ankyrin repeat protein n=1 Tax=Hesseltinella vesiculosa TaxID=101127 RepID=A0A1X2GHZ8_9FUNG|nr:ankyrin repeat protein [Hesseltinella vesiculosa]
MNDEGASNNELLMAACRNDQEDVVEEILEGGNFDVGYTDGAGNTAAHLAAKSGALGCLEHLVNLDDIDLNIKNRMEGYTPLHFAVEYQKEDVEMAIAMVDILLQGGSDPKIENRNKLTAAMMVQPQNKELKTLLSKAVRVDQFDEGDFADDLDYDSDDDQPSD